MWNINLMSQYSSYSRATTKTMRVITECLSTIEADLELCYVVEYVILVDTALNIRLAV
jgi:ribosomal protein L28